MDKVISLLGVNISVEEVDVVCKEDPRKGEYNYLTGVIKLDQNMPTNMKNQVLMHELLHAMFDFLGLDELRDDEQKVQMIATGLHQLFTQNEVFYTGKDEFNG